MKETNTSFFFLVGDYMAGNKNFSRQSCPSFPSFIPTKTSGLHDPVTLSSGCLSRFRYEVTSFRLLLKTEREMVPLSLSSSSSIYVKQKVRVMNKPQRQI